MSLISKQALREHQYALSQLILPLPLYYVRKVISLGVLEDKAGSILTSVVYFHVFLVFNQYDNVIDRGGKYQHSQMGKKSRMYCTWLFPLMKASELVPIQWVTWVDFFATQNMPQHMDKSRLQDKQVTANHFQHCSDSTKKKNKIKLSKGISVPVPKAGDAVCKNILP